MWFPRRRAKRLKNMSFDIISKEEPTSVTLIRRAFVSGGTISAAGRYWLDAVRTRLIPR
jgi:hypothetical protein